MFVCHEYFILETVERNGKRFFKKDKGPLGLDVYFAITRDGEREPISKTEILESINMCLNVTTSDYKTFRLSHENDTYILRNFKKPNITKIEKALKDWETGKSYGWKAQIYEDKKEIKLYSFENLTCKIDKLDWTIIFYSDASREKVSQVTLKHIRSFLKYANFCTYAAENFYTKQYNKLPLNVTITAQDFIDACGM